MVFGLCGCFLSGLGYFLAGFTNGWPLASLLLLCLGRVILGIGQSFAGTGSTLWGVGVVGSMHIGRVISWNGIVTYGAMAIGAPLGVLFMPGWLTGIGADRDGRGAVGNTAGAPSSGGEGQQRQTIAVSRGAWACLVVRHGAGPGLSRIWRDRHFHHPVYDAKGWDGAAFALTLFSCTFVGTRLLFPNGINRLGGLNVAMICFSVEIVGLLLVGMASMPWMAKAASCWPVQGFRWCSRRWAWWR